MILSRPYFHQSLRKVLPLKSQKFITNEKNAITKFFASLVNNKNTITRVEPTLVNDDNSLPWI